MKKYLYILTLCVFALSSCKKDAGPGGTAVQNMANEWWVQVQTVNPTTGAVIDNTDKHYYKLSTYNTSDNSSTMMWFDDSDAKGYNGEKIKVNVVQSSLTFSVTNAADVSGNIPAPGTVSVANGKIIPNGAVGPSSKAVTDAISYDVTLASDVTPVIYRFTGYARTRFVGDDH
ncbi:lipid-binding protein [Pedobacter cryoconitis]|uniref:Lipid-binding hydrolase n=1 Tax=Pedobacter cryoconitis TaxID=188932 RepID=A0A7X0MHZ5_9SPHI|nr:lipid-binding protein [Pedobacter cryoconitis]MBB6499639.1 hypothetical protein [Pedobacter cryoconitis]